MTFDHVDRIKTEHKSTTADLGVGLGQCRRKEVSLYVSADYSGNVDDDNLEGLMGNLGDEDQLVMGKTTTRRSYRAPRCLSITRRTA